MCGDDLNIYSGNDDQILPVLSVGGIGVISVLSNILPKYTTNMVDNYFNGNLKIATKMQVNSIDLVNSLFKEVNPIPVKAALDIMGFKFGKLRLPLIECTAELKEQLKNNILQLKEKL